MRSLSQEEAWDHENHSFITCHTTEILGWHNLLDIPEVNLLSDWRIFSTFKSYNVLSFVYMVIFLTHYQWWSIWKAKCDYAIGQSLKATQRRKKKCHKNDRNSWKTAQTHKESSAFICILGLQTLLPTDPTPPASLVLFLFRSWFQADFYDLEQFQMLTGTLYIYKDKEALNNNYIQAPWKELGKMCQL